MINNNHGQGTIEYLIIISIVVVISLVIVVFAIDFINLGTSSSQKSQNIGQKLGTLAVIESIVSPSGQYALVLKSNDSDSIKVTKIFVDDIEQTYVGKNNLSTGSSQLFPVYLNETCDSGSQITKTIRIIYESTQGLEKSAMLENTKIPCDNYVLGTDNMASAADSSVIILYSPGNNSNLGFDTPITFNYNVFTVGTDINYCNLLINDEIDQTIQSPSMPNSFTKTFSSTGTYTWDVECENLLEYSSTAQNGPLTLNIVNDPPAITLLSPANSSIQMKDVQITFNYSAIDSDGLDECRLLIDGVPVISDSIITIPDSLSYAISSAGEHDWDIECEDIAGTTATASNSNAPWALDVRNGFSCTSDNSDINITSVDFFGNEDLSSPAVCIGIKNESALTINSWCGGVYSTCYGYGYSECTGVFADRFGACFLRGQNTMDFKSYYGFPQAMEYGCQSNSGPRGCYISSIAPEEEVFYCTNLGSYYGTYYPTGTIKEGTITFTTDTLGTVTMSCAGPIQNGYYAYSCPFLYAFGNNGMFLVNDLFPQGMLGVFNDLGRRKPYPNDFLIIDKPLDKVNEQYLLDIRQTPDEVSYIDEVKLYYVDVPVGYDVAPGAASFTTNWELEGTRAIQDETITLHTINQNANLPRTCFDQNGEDCLSKISTRDYQIETEEEYKFSEQEAIIGTQFKWDVIELDLGDLSKAEDIKLVISGVTSWPSAEEWSSNPNATGTKPAFIEVLDEKGNWVFGSYMSIPNGFGKLFAFPIKDIFKTNNYRIRLNIFAKSDIDLILVDTTKDKEINLVELGLNKAELYNFGKGKGYSGMATKYGEVNPLLEEKDDKFAIITQGDGIRLFFNEEKELTPNNTIRKYVFGINGYFKQEKYGLERTIEPLPFSQMTNYPYPANESYPNTQEYQEYRKEWNTREIIVK